MVTTGNIGLEKSDVGLNSGAFGSSFDLLGGTGADDADDELDVAVVVDDDAVVVV